jgi:hypothetical protein
VVRIALDQGGILGALAFVVYAWLAPSHVVAGDNAEFSTLSALGGAAHPPGYPLYVLWLRAWSWLPGTPAHAAALATALLGAVAVVVLHAACRAWGVRPLAATVACALFAAAPVVITFATEAEVFALNHVIVAAILWFAAARGPWRGAWRAAALGLVAGLGLANHHTCVLVAPLGLLGVVRAAREGGALRSIIIAIAGLAVGLLPYLYLVVAPVHDGAWGNAHDLVGMFLRRDYGGPGAFATQGDDVAAVTSLAALARTLGRTWLWLPGLAGLASATARVVRAAADGERESRWGWAMLLVSLALAGPLLVLRFNVAPRGIGLYVVERFHLLPALLLAIPVADAIDRLVGASPARAVHALALVGFLAVTASALPHVASVHGPSVEQAARNTLLSLPAGAVLIGDDDDLGFTVPYLQLVRGERPDVQYVQASLLGRPWYLARLVTHGFSIDGLVNDALARGLPVFVQPYERDLLAKFPSYRFGIVVRLLPVGRSAPTLADVVRLNEDLYRGFEIDAQPGPDDEISTAVHRRYAMTWNSLARALDQAGEPAAAARARDYAAAIGPAP